MPRFFRLISIPMFATVLLVSQIALTQHWRPVRGGILYGISGMALIRQQGNALDFLVVHDNKKPDQGRLGVIKIQGEEQPKYLPIAWPSNTELPIDLEGLVTVPEVNPSYMALTSSGKVFQFSLDINNNISLIKIFDLPGISKETNLESFALHKLDGKLIAIWAHRGAGEQPGVMYWGELNLKNYKITPTGSVAVKVPMISGNIRHISDIKVDSAGVTYITSAVDNGDDGPFKSAVYVAGTFTLKNRKIAFQQNLPVTGIAKYDYHKIEALELLPNAEAGMIVGTDDENMGSSVYLLK